jgi:hypothetical protein
MLARLVGVGTLVAVLALGLLALPALAVEEDDAEGAGGYRGPLPALDELGTQSETSQRFFPEEAAEPVFAPFLLYPLLVVGFLAAFVVLVLYLKWQPTFTEERKKVGRR